MELHETPSGLLAPHSYLQAPPAVRARVCNGCGTKGWKGLLVPETLYGLCVAEACDIHDWMYHVGQTEVDRYFADEVFHSNLNRLISKGTWWMRLLRRHRALHYFSAVREFGRGPFANKG